MRYLVEIIINILLILLYVIVSTLENKTISTIFSIVLIILLIFSILRISVNLIKEKRKKKIIFILTNIFLIIVVLLWNYTINNLEEIINVFGSYYISNLETDNYNSEFIPFKKLSSANDWNNITSGKQYIQSFYSINKIISMSNETVIKNLLLELKNSDFNIAFEKVVGEEFPTFENNIKNEMQNVKNKKANIKSNGKI